MKNKSQIGIISAVSLVIGNMMGSGVLILPSSLAVFGNYSFIGWGITSIGAIALSLIFVKLSYWIKKSGGPYVFAKEVFGDFIGFQSAWCYWIFSWISNVALISSGIAYLSTFTSFDNSTTVIIGLGMIWWFTFLNLLDFKVFAKIQIFIALLKTLPIIIFAILTIPHCSIPNYESCTDLYSSISQSVALTLWAFIGLESATIPVSELNNSRKIVPIATILGVVITATTYIIGSLSISSVLPQETIISSSTPYVTATTKIFGSGYGLLMAIIGFVSLLGTLNGWIMIQGFVPMTASLQGLFPKIFQKQNKNNIPYFGIILGSVLMSIVFLLSNSSNIKEQFKIVIELSCFFILVPYIFSLSAAFILAITKYKETFSKKFNKIFFLFICLIGYCYIAYAFIGLDKNVCMIGMISLLLSSLFFKKNKSNS